ncbi:hypothetical protein B0H66DRAFT_503003 [Apodospora peruviana]|uniref:Uncharacterized protein n=1 Tax=Apodospora peruviana TaxID=516989 RepID=A0AAE0HV48_9PEZI|nr:hypothetical protein B0H66DRAFT_503003 [Apodospora peruviana]
MHTTHTTTTTMAESSTTASAAAAAPGVGNGNSSGSGPSTGAVASSNSPSTNPATTNAPYTRRSTAIPVSLAEAALDSPTFRAVTVHFSDQLDGIERWLDAYVRSTSKLVHDMLALEDTINTYLAKLMPPTSTPSSNTIMAVGAEAAMDADYTLPALRKASDGARGFWSGILGTVRRLDPVSAEPIKAFVNGDLRTFRETRRALEQTQKTFDSALARYVGQHKTKEPSALREDAFALYETRRAYMKASMDFCQLAPQVRFSLDKVLVRVCADLYREMNQGQRKSGGAVGVVGEELERIRGWSKEMEASESVFRRELQMARRDIGEATLNVYRPSRELEDYAVSTVPYLGTRGPAANLGGGIKGENGEEVSSEKQGWLFLRVMSGKPVRTTWIRRWYYCRNGIFGWLVQAPQGGVLQGDEIGVLLCSAKPAVGEERRFCFEIKTKAQTLMLQAETQAQLVEWIDAFDAAKKKAFEASMGRDQTSLPGGVDPAFAITAPSIPEFSAKMLFENVDEAGGGSTERAGTLPVPGPDGNLASRTSFDAAANPPRRSITTLGREDGESGRDHAARIMQKLDLHRKATFATSSTDTTAAAAGIASLITASQSLLPGYNTSATAPSPSAAHPPALRLPSNPDDQHHHAGSLAPATLAKPPIPTNLSKAAVAASAITDPSRGLPSAVLANYWGSGPMASSMGSPVTAAFKPEFEDPFVDATFQARTPTTPVSATHRKTMSVDTKAAITGAGRAQENKPVADTFPPDYPPELRAQYAQFRLVFPGAALEEKPVLVFNAAWTSSSGEGGKEGQRMAANGRIFVTPDNMYFYGHQMGLVIAYTMNLDNIAEVTAAPGKDCDFIFLHLSQEMQEMGFHRITIKVFLEDFSLLQARLNLLVDDLQAEEPMDLSEVVAALINLDSEEDKKSPSAESWEEVSSNTPIDDGTPYGRPVSRRVRDLNRSRGRVGELRRHIPKVQLPTHPVVYEPEDMGRSVAERHFEISAKACFHVLFGDKSFIFPKLYFERRAKEIAQGPWELQDHGTMKRQFKFKVDYVDMLGRAKPSDVADTQTIDIYSEHITYVVTHIKTPWHLPHSQAFRLVTKVVITHVAKSKCKLAIYTKADWSKTPAFAKSMVQRQALDDAANDAEELAEVATDQVRKLGPHGRTKRAIQVYGGIGQQTQVVVFSPAPDNPGAVGSATETKKGGANSIRPRTLTDMLLETGRSFLESAITSVMMWAFAAVRRLFRVLSANRVILLLLLGSAAYNLVVVSQASSAWWAERKAARYMSRIGVGPNLMMSKTIYIRDLEEAAHGSSVEMVRPVGSQCYDAFQAMVNMTDPDALYSEAGAGLLSATSKATARRLRRTRQRLGGYRHDLLVAMRVVNGIEREVMQSEWENWLSDENARCEQARSMLLMLSPGQDDDQGQDTLQKPLGSRGDGEEEREEQEKKEALRTWYKEYCGSCEADRRELLGAVGVRGSLV